ncbi:hypothetical protein ACFQU7_12875 [Pseudoroseomonas wenyumeiae]
MDIGVPLKDLGAIDVSGLLKMIETLTEDDWTGNTFRQDAVASTAHSATDNIMIKTEWHPTASTSGLQHFEDLICVWARAKGMTRSPSCPSRGRIRMSGRSIPCRNGTASRTCWAR